MEPNGLQHPQIFPLSSFSKKSIVQEEGCCANIDTCRGIIVVDYIVEMQGLGFSISIFILKLKVAFITQGRDMMFTNDIPNPSWLR
jgi:hypothetical protein